MVKTQFLIKNILLLYFISYTKEDICPDEEINVSPLVKCKKIKDILEGRDLSMKEENLFYLSSNNNGKIEKNGYKLDIYKLNDTKLQSHNVRKSKLYMPNSCIKKIENSPLLFNRNKGIIIIVQDFNNINSNNISDEYFIILYNSSNTQIKYLNSKKYDFSLCNENPIIFEHEINIDYLRYFNNKEKKIDINQILYGRKFKIDLFNLYSDFFMDICYKFTSETGTDVTLESRVEDYYQNITFCDEHENSHYISFNYSKEKNSLIYRCAIGFFKNEFEKSSYLDKVDNIIKALVSVSNIKVITCYKKILNVGNILGSYGGIIYILVFIIQIIFFTTFLFIKIKSFKKNVNRPNPPIKVRKASVAVKVNNFQLNLNAIHINYAASNENNRNPQQKVIHFTEAKQAKTEEVLNDNHDNVDNIQIENDNYEKNFCEYYKESLLLSHVLLNLFSNDELYNYFIIKLSILFMTFPINLTCNIFFFTEQQIKLTYIRAKDGISLFMKNIVNTIYSSLISTILLYILKLLYLTRKKNCPFVCVIMRIILYFILSFFFLLIFGFYVICFCAIFENTQIEFIIATSISWGISLFNPFIFCFIISIIRSLGLRCGSKLLLAIQQILEFLFISN